MNSSKVDVNLPEHGEAGEVQIASQKVARNEDERYSYLPVVRVITNCNSLNAVFYKPTPNKLEQMAKHVDNKEKNAETFKKDWR